MKRIRSLSSKPERLTTASALAGDRTRDAGGSRQPECQVSSEDFCFDLRASWDRLQYKIRMKLAAYDKQKQRHLINNTYLINKLINKALINEQLYNHEKTLT
ncbi:hypothetical protein Syun_015150 [Stephania yunnanensis]|uniref:Uncharacterized protein n=1 Tax=Stephania yunnanensis TaxID=152371 RepID=A0AAP0PCL5_9MAGN